MLRQPALMLASTTQAASVSPSRLFNSLQSEQGESRSPLASPNAPGAPTRRQGGQSICRFCFYAQEGVIRDAVAFSATFWKTVKVYWDVEHLGERGVAEMRATEHATQREEQEARVRMGLADALNNFPLPLKGSAIDYKMINAAIRSPIHKNVPCCLDFVLESDQDAMALSFSLLLHLPTEPHPIVLHNGVSRKVSVVSPEAFRDILVRFDPGLNLRFGAFINAQVRDADDVARRLPPRKAGAWLGFKPANPTVRRASLH